MTAKVLGVVNQKGGVGKSTTASNIGRGFAEDGLRTLLIDLDPQGNLTKGIYPTFPDEFPEGAFVDAPEGLRPGFGNAYILFSEGAKVKPITVEENGYSFDLLVASKHLAEISEKSFDDGIANFKENIESMADQYDVIVIDSLPSMGNLQVAVHASADFIAIPVQFEAWAISGLERLVEVLVKVKKMINPKVELLAIYGSIVSPQETNVEYTWKEQLKETYGDAVLDDIFITRGIKVVEANNFGQTVKAYSPKSRQAGELARLKDEMKRRMGIEEVTA